MAFGLGPRVGGAHVDVNLRFRDRSVSQVGRQIHQQLREVSRRNSRIYRRLGQEAVTAWRASLGAIISAAPLAGSAISGVAGAATMLAGALSATAQSAYGLAPLLTAVGIAAGTARIGMTGFMDAVNAKTAEDLAKALANLSPAARDSAMAVRSLRDEARRLRMAVQERMFAGLADDIERLAYTLFPVMERGLGKMADALNGLAQSVLDYVNSAAGLEQIEKLLDNSADIFDRLAKSAVPFLDGTLRLLDALSPAAKRLADRITDVALSFQSWTQAEGFGNRIDEMMKRAEKTAGLLLKVLGNLGQAIGNVFRAANPATNTFLEMLIGVTERFKEWSDSVSGQNSIAKWASESVEVMRQFGKTLEAVFEVMVALSDSRVIISFLTTVQNAFEHLSRLPLEQMVSAFADMAEVLQPISGLILAAIIGFATFGVLLGNIIGQTAGLVRGLGAVFGPLESAGKHGKTLTGISAAFGRIAAGASAAIRPIADLFRPLASAGKHGKSLTGVAAAMARISSIAIRLAKFIPFAGWAVWIGTVIAKSEDLQKKLGKIFSGLKDVFSAVAGAASEILDSLSAFAPAVEKVGSAFDWAFGYLDKFLEALLSDVFDRVIGWLEGVAEAIEGLGKIISGTIDIVSGFFLLFKDPEAGFKKMLDGAKKLTRGIPTLFRGMFNAIKSILTPTLFLNLAKDAFGAILTGARVVLIDLPGEFLRWAQEATMALVVTIAQSIPAVSAAIGSLIVEMLKWFIQLPGQVLGYANETMIKLLGAIVEYTPMVLEAVASLFTGIVNWFVQLPGRLFELGTSAITQLASAVSTGIAKLSAIAGRILTGIVSALASLPGDLFKLGVKAIADLASAITDGIRDAVAAAADIVTKIMNVIEELPGKMLQAGKNAVSSLAKGIADKTGLSSVVSAGKKLAGAVGNLWPGSPVKDGPLTAWNRGGDASGGGYNVVKALAKGFEDTTPIERAMGNMAAMVASTPLTPSISPVGSAGYGGGSSIRNTYGNINVTISVDDLAKMNKVDDFLRMLDRSRVAARQTSRSGTVTA